MFLAELGVGAHGGPSERLAQVAYLAEVHAFVLNAMALRSSVRHAELIERVT
ncbi:MAG TPA: hypothetical protein VFQ44_00910 [Streptosporangiaceae bacterium]|nr:hypothetical protein [Streptosporangiaceae bacterium]